MRKILGLIFFIVSFGLMAQTDFQQVDGDTAKVGTTGKNRISIRNGRMYFRSSTGIKKEIVSTNNTYTNPTWLNIDKNKVGLGNADNTSDANKPVSTATQTALNLKVDKTTTVNGYALSSNVSLAKSDVGLGNVPNVDATNPANITQSSSYRFVTDTEKSTWNGKENVLTFSSPLSRATNTISIPAATSSVNGYLSSADWTTFNGKFATPTGLTTNTIPKWGGSAFSNSLITDNGSNVTIANDAFISGHIFGKAANSTSNLKIGYGSIISLTSGINNAGIGENSLYSLVTGDGNTAFGRSALTNINNSSNNVAVGYNAGRYISDGTTPNAISNTSIYIGNATKANANNQTNQIVVGYDATGNGSNRAVYGNSSITDSRVYGNLLLGSNTNSGEMLQVNGTSKLAGNTSITGNLSATGLHTFTGTTASDKAPLGSELLSTSNWTSTGWTGDFTVGFTHTAGNTTTLSNTLAAMVGTYYQITYTITGRTAGGITITFGGEALSGITATGATGPKATTTGNLLIDPTTDFNGTLVISIKVISVSSASVSFNSSSGASTNQIRISNISYNSFFGLNAGQLNTTGTNNSFIGTSAGYSNTTGYSNSFIGVSAGQNNTTGNTNSFIGVSAGQSNTTGNSNSFFGVSAGYSNTTGYYNSFIGVSAGRYIADGVTANSTANNSIFIGGNTKALADNQTNQIAIGHNATGLGSNSTVIGNSSTTLTKLFGKLNIGTVPTYADNAAATSGGLSVGDVYRTSTGVLMVRY